MITKSILVNLLALLLLLIPTPAYAGTFRMIVTLPIYIIGGAVGGPIFGFGMWCVHELNRDEYLSRKAKAKEDKDAGK